MRSRFNIEGISKLDRVIGGLQEYEFVGMMAQFEEPVSYRTYTRSRKARGVRACTIRKIINHLNTLFPNLGLDFSADTTAVTEAAATSEQLDRTHKRVPTATALVVTESKLDGKPMNPPPDALFAPVNSANESMASMLTPNHSSDLSHEAGYTTGNSSSSSTQEMASSPVRPAVSEELVRSEQAQIAKEVPPADEKPKLPSSIHAYLTGSETVDENPAHLTGCDQPFKRRSLFLKCIVPTAALAATVIAVMLGVSVNYGTSSSRFLPTELSSNAERSAVHVPDRKLAPLPQKLTEPFGNENIISGQDFDHSAYATRGGKLVIKPHFEVGDGADISVFVGSKPVSFHMRETGDIETVVPLEFHQSRLGIQIDDRREGSVYKSDGVVEIVSGS